MPNKCAAFGCNSNKNGYEKKAAFRIPEDETLKKLWLKFLNRKDLSTDVSYIYICELHFNDMYLNRKNNERVRLIKTMNPVPSIHPVVLQEKMPSVLPNVTPARKPPRQRVFRPDEIDSVAYNKLSIDSFSDVSEALLKCMDTGYAFSKHEDHAVFYKMEIDEKSVPKVTECIRVDDKLHVQLFFNSCPVPLPPWFRKGHNCKLTSITQLENFASYIRSRNEDFPLSAIAKELESLKYQTRPVYSASLLRYSLLLRYTSLQTYKMLQKEFRLPSVVFLRKLKQGVIDPIKSSRILKENGSISEDVILMFDEMYLQKSEQYSGGNLIGSDGEGNLFKGIMCFMIVGLKSSVPFVIKSVPESGLSSTWLEDEIKSTLDVLHDAGFKVKGVVCDNHSSNVSAYRRLLVKYGEDSEDLSISCNGEKIYLFYDTVHLVKNIRNNLVGRKRFIFPPFKFSHFSDEIYVPGGEVSWKVFHDIHEKDKALSSNLKKAPSINAQVLHPGNCKQSVPPALAIFNETTTAAIKSYFPDREDAAQFLHLINTWWTLSNSKARYNGNNRIGDAAKLGDKKPEFLRAFADWLLAWQATKIPNCQKFQLSAQTNDALVRTLQCHAAMIEDLLATGDYEYILTARFQSDPLERRYGQYRQMSGGRFLVSLREVVCSENILKMKSLLKAKCDIEQAKFVQDPDELEIEVRRIDEEISIVPMENLTLDQESREVSNVIAGYVARKLKPDLENCCSDLLLEEFTDGSYLATLSRGGLLSPSQSLSDQVAHSFAVLDSVSDDLRGSILPARVVAERVLSNTVLPGDYCCDEHMVSTSKKISRIVTNVFLNNERKRKTSSVVADKVQAFKKLKRDKRGV